MTWSHSAFSWAIACSKVAGLLGSAGWCAGGPVTWKLELPRPKNWVCIQITSILTNQNQTLSLLAHHAPAKKQALHSSHTNHQGITSPPFLLSGGAEPSILTLTRG